MFRFFIHTCFFLITNSIVFSDIYNGLIFYSNSQGFGSSKTFLINNSYQFINIWSHPSGVVGIPHLFKDGSMVGLNDKLLGDYVEWTANKRMKAIGLRTLYDISPRNNPLPWTQHWLNSKELQNAPQETEIESYVIGSIKQDITDDTFKGMKL